MPEEPCQCPDCQRFYREHDRLIRECPTLRQQQELSWAALQAFRTLSGRVLEDLQKQHGAPTPEAQAHATPVGATEEPVDAMQQAMGWFADSMRLRDVIQVVSSIEIPLPGMAELGDGEDGDGPLDPPADGGSFSGEPPLAA